MSDAENARSVHNRIAKEADFTRDIRIAQLEAENAALRAQVEMLREALGKLVRLANASHPEYAGMYRLREGILANPDVPFLKREIGRCIADALAASPDSPARIVIPVDDETGRRLAAQYLDMSPLTADDIAETAKQFPCLFQARDEEREAEKAVVEAATLCGYCNGTGEVACSSTNYMTCPDCKGKGIIRAAREKGEVK